MSTSKVNATVDSNIAKASAKPKGLLRVMPPQPVKVQSVPKEEATRSTKPKSSADIPRVQAPVVKQSIAVEAPKGGKVNKSA
ncbi:MAG: hypothetical protein HQK85_12560 [Nitrospinae bacterium]|nr:hypothetical protein [Nitrospinota bacterium]